MGKERCTDHLGARVVPKLYAASFHHTEVPHSPGEPAETRADPGKQQVHARAQCSCVLQVFMGLAPGVCANVSHGMQISHKL